MPHPGPPRIDADDPFAVAVHSSPPARFVSLCWDVFFESRGRGVSMQAHFPWLDRPQQACFVTLQSGPELLAGCAIRFIADSTQQRRGGAIGLVCVDPRHRGQGHSTRVLERAIEHAADLGLADLVLWTGKPGVYQRQGFRTDDDAVLGRVRAAAGTPKVALDVDARPWPGSADPRGLPPFATHAVRWQAACASAIVLHDAGGAILAEWTGDGPAVADLLAQVMPASWRINALAGDPLLRTLVERGCTLDLQPAPLRMVRSLEAADVPPRDYDRRVLDRI